ncbi:MAG: pyridoxal-dependent decarboxylase, partial [Alphaproteobacteria bacterium]
SKAVELLGLGAASLRAIATDEAGAMVPEALRETIERDRVAGFMPMAVVATAGSASTGAIDPLARVADVAERAGLWLHVDGAFGALARLDRDLAPLMDGIERAHSIAFDFHKWLHVPYDAGCVLVRDGACLPDVFATHADYLEAGRALAGGAPWFGDLGPELSRGFRALKVWFTLRHFGLDRLGRSIAHNCALARHLARRIKSEPGARLLAPVALNIVCFRFEPPGRDETTLDRLTEDVVAALQAGGLAAPSTTRIGGRLAIRAAILNHRTTEADIDAFFDDAARLARARAPTGA